MAIAKWYRPWFVEVLLLTSLAGCFGGKGPAGVALVPVSGQVYVDGQPAAMVQVICHAVDGKTSTIPPAVSDEMGRFRLSTVQQGDGVPAGHEYVLTFRWAEFDSISMSFRGEDKFQGRYENPSNSPIRFRAEKGRPVDLRIDLSIGE